MKKTNFFFSKLNIDNVTIKKLEDGAPHISTHETHQIILDDSNKMGFDENVGCMKIDSIIFSSEEKLDRLISATINWAKTSGIKKISLNSNDILISEELKNVLEKYLFIESDPFGTVKIFDLYFYENYEY